MNGIVPVETMDLNCSNIYCLNQNNKTKAKTERRKNDETLRPKRCMNAFRFRTFVGGIEACSALPQYHKWIQY